MSSKGLNNCVDVFLSVCLSVRLSVCLSICPSVCLSVYLSVSLSVCLSVRLSVCLSICPSVCLSVYLSVSLSVCLSVRLSVCLFVYLSDRGMGRILYNGVLCSGNLNRMGRVAGVKWVRLHFFTKKIFVTRFSLRPSSECRVHTRYRVYIYTNSQYDAMASAEISIHDGMFVVVINNNE